MDYDAVSVPRVEPASEAHLCGIEVVEAASVGVSDNGAAPASQTAGG